MLYTILKICHFIVGIDFGFAGVFVCVCVFLFVFFVGGRGREGGFLWVSVGGGGWVMYGLCFPFFFFFNFLCCLAVN